MTGIRNRLKEVLDEEGMTLRDLERAILLLGEAVSYQALHAIYHNRSKGTTFRVMELICRATGRQIGDLFYIEDGDGDDRKGQRGG